MFGKPYADYLRYQAPLLIAIAVVGLVRLALSISGQPDSMVKYFSITAVGAVGIVYYALTVRRRGFGSYREMLVLIFNQTFLANGIAIVGIVVAMMGLPNIYDVPEFRPPFAREATPIAHALAHLVLGNSFGTFFGWLIGSVFMAIGGGRARD